MEMSVTEEYKEYILEKLQKIGKITIKRMFGSIGVYNNGYFVAIIHDNQLFLKVDASNESLFRDRDMDIFTYQRQGKSQTLQFYSVPEDIIEDDKLFRDWLSKSTKVAQNQKET